jgi:ankyrin repeat protein
MPKGGARDRVQQGLALLKAAKDCDPDALQKLLDARAPIDFTDPVDHATALHYTVAYASRPALRVLLRSARCNFLMRDREGRLPSQLAREFGQDRAMARLLLIKEIRQAKALRIDPSTLYSRSPKHLAADKADAPKQQQPAERPEDSSPQRKRHKKKQKRADFA